ncbi:hypothetical protein RJJ65_40865, partial [Rhizobium hidalgonense]
FYAQVYQAQPQGTVKLVRSNLGQSGYVVLDQANERSIGLLVYPRGNYAYVVQHTQKNFNDALMKQNLAQLAGNIQIPGRKLKNSDSELPLSIDLAQSSPEQLATWKNTA